MATNDFVVKNGLVVTDAADILSTTDASSSSDTAASIYTAGGLAVAKKVFVGTTLGVGTDLTVTGDLAVNGGDITTTATTFNLLNGTATTVNFAGAGTSINVGNTTSAQTINFGNASTGTSTYNLATGPTALGLFKTVNVGTGSTNTSQTDVVLGSSSTLGALLSTTTYTTLTGTSVTTAATYTTVSQSATSGTGSGAQFTVTKTGSGTAYSGVTTVTVTAAGQNYLVGDTITLPGNLLGGATPANDLTFTLATAVNNGGTTTVNSRTLVGLETTQNVFNTVATTVNAFGAAGTINLGANSGTLTIGNPTVVGTQTTQNLYNTVATTVNFAGAATTLTVGATTGTTTIRNGLSVNGNVTLGDASGDTVTINASTVSIPNAITFTEDDSQNNSISYPVTFTHTTTGVPANGIGTGIQLITETTAGNNEIGLQIDSVVTDVTATSEDFDLVFKQMIAGVAPAQTFKLNGATMTVGANNTATTITTQGTANLTISTNSGTNSGTILINNGANGNIEIAPNGTGDVYLTADTVRVGDANTAATITTNGTGDLTINTNAGTNSGSITIANGANGNITIEPNGTGDVYVNADTLRIGDNNVDAFILSNGTGNLIVNPGANLVIGDASFSATPTSKILRATYGLGTNINGANLQLLGGLSTGNATGGSITFSTGTILATGSTLQPASTRMSVTPSTNNATLDLVTEMTTANVFNTNATIGNLFGAATGVNVAINAATASTMTFGAAISANTFKIGSTAAGTITLSSDVTTGTVNLYTGVTTGVVNLATAGANTLNFGGAATTVNLGTTSGDSILEVRGNSTTGIATIRTNTGVVTANVFNTVATTGNLFGAGTTISVGANSGTITIKNPTVVGTETTVNLWNTVSTTVNAFGVATGINLGINAAALSTMTFGPAITGNIFKIGSTASGTINLTSDVTTGVVNAYTGVTTGTINLATGGASTTNIGGAAGVVNIGTTGGDSTLTIRGNSTTGTGTIATNAATASVFNTNATTVNAFGASTAVNIGAITGTVTIANPTLTMTRGTAFNMNGVNPVIASTDTGTANIFNANITAINFGQAADITMSATGKTVTVNGALSVKGNTTIGDAATDTITFNTDVANVNTTNNLSFTVDDAINNAISYPIKLVHTTTGAPANGIGTGLQFITETTAGNKIGGVIETVSTDVTSASEDFDLQFRTMVAGATATQVLRFNSTTHTIGAASTAQTINTQTGSSLSITTGATGAAAAGNTATFSGGLGGATSGAGGAATFKGGDAQTSGAGGAATFKAGAAVGTNIVGTNTIIEAGNGTGTGGSGSIVFRIAAAGSSGATPNTLTDALTITSAGGVTLPGDVTVGGNLVVNGTLSTINSSTVTVDDKNLELASVASVTGLQATLSTGTNVVTLTNGTKTTGLIPGMTVTVTSGTGAFGAAPTILSVDNATQITLSVNHAVAGAVVFSSGGATDDTANGGGITVKGTTDKTWNYVHANTAWTSNQNIDIANTKTYKINAIDVLSSSAVLQNATTASIGSLAAATDVRIGANNQNNTLTIHGNSTGGTATLTTNVTTGIGSIFNDLTGTIRLANSATTWTIGHAATQAQTVDMFGGSTAASIYRFAHGATANATIKTIEIGTNGVSGSTTNIILGSSVSGALGTSTINGATVNLGTNQNSLATTNVGPQITGNIFKVRSPADGTGTINFTTDLTTGAVNMFSSLTSGSVNIAVGTGASVINLAGPGGTLNVGTVSGNSTLTINGNGTNGTATIATNVTTGTVNLFPSLNTSAAILNIASSAGLSNINIGGPSATVNIGTTSGNSVLTVRGGGTAGTATINTNVTTGAVDFMRALTTGTMTIGSAAAGTLAILFNKASTSTTTGAVTIGGGLGVNGAINALTKSFIIPHPTKPNMLLKHGSLEGPEFGVYVRGKLTNGRVIELPEYWSGLVDADTITVDLTAIGKHQKLYVEKIEDNKVYVGNDAMFGGNVTCFYTVWGERKDVGKLDIEADIE